MSRVAPILALCLLAAPTGPASAITPEELLSRAKAVRLQAEKDLAAGRQQHLAERKALATELQKAYATLAAAREDRRKAQESLERLRGAAGGLDRDEALNRRRIRALIVQAATSAGAIVEPSESIEAMERTIWSGFQRRLDGVAPLLGLLGTASGMIATFSTISATGTGNPRLLSGGISEALITTQLGLMVAIPLLLAHAGLRRWVERCTPRIGAGTTSSACWTTSADASWPGSCNPAWTPRPSAR